jgi:hypothetical protein
MMVFEMIRRMRTTILVSLVIFFFYLFVINKMISVIIKFIIIFIVGDVVEFFLIYVFENLKIMGEMDLIGKRIYGCFVYDFMLFPFKIMSKILSYKMNLG